MCVGFCDAAAACLLLVRAAAAAAAQLAAKVCVVFLHVVVVSRAYHSEPDGGKATTATTPGEPRCLLAPCDQALATVEAATHGIMEVLVEVLVAEARVIALHDASRWWERRCARLSLFSSVVPPGASSTELPPGRPCGGLKERGSGVGVGREKSWRGRKMAEKIRTRWAFS
jgi:hypothetical protein